MILFFSLLQKRRITTVPNAGLILSFKKFGYRRLINIMLLFLNNAIWILPLTNFIYFRALCGVIANLGCYVFWLSFSCFLFFNFSFIIFRSYLIILSLVWWLFLKWPKHAKIKYAKKLCSCTNAANICTLRLFWVKFNLYLFRSTSMPQIVANNVLSQSWNWTFGLWKAGRAQKTHTGGGEVTNTETTQPGLKPGNFLLFWDSTINSTMLPISLLSIK